MQRRDAAVSCGGWEQQAPESTRWGDARRTSITARPITTRAAEARVVTTRAAIAGVLIVAAGAGRSVAAIAACLVVIARATSRPTSLP